MCYTLYKDSRGFNTHQFSHTVKERNVTAHVYKAVVESVPGDAPVAEIGVFPLGEVPREPGDILEKDNELDTVVGKSETPKPNIGQTISKETKGLQMPMNAAVVKQGATLPATGEEANGMMMAVGMSALFSALGFFGLKRNRKEE